MNSQWDFDFSVRVSTHAVSATPGQSIQIPAMVQLHRGVPKPVILTVSTSWASAGIVAQIIPPTVTPAPGAMATLHIVVSANTPPGSYMVAVRAETSGTFKTSEDTVTVVVTPSKEPPENNDGEGDGETPETPASPIPAVAAAPLLARKARPVSPGQRSPKPQQHRPPVVMRLFFMLMLALGMGVIFYSVSQYSGSSNDSGSSAADTYVGTQTFSINSVLGNAPQSSTGAASVQIDSSGNVLGPVLFGKITNGSFTGEARTQDGTTFPMTGTLSGGTFQASYHSSGPNWTWTLYKQ